MGLAPERHPLRAIARGLVYVLPVAVWAWLVALGPLARLPDGLWRAVEPIVDGVAWLLFMVVAFTGPPLAWIVFVEGAPSYWRRNRSIFLIAPLLVVLTVAVWALMARLISPSH